MYYAVRSNDVSITGPVALPPSQAPPTGHHQPVSMYPSMPPAVYPAQIPPSMQAVPHMPFAQTGPASVHIGFGGISVGFQPPPTAPSQFGYQMYPSFAQPGPAPWHNSQQQMPPAQPGPAPWHIPQQQMPFALPGSSPLQIPLQPMPLTQQIPDQSIIDGDDSDSDDSTVDNTDTSEFDAEEDDGQYVFMKYYVIPWCTIYGGNKAFRCYYVTCQKVNQNIAEHNLQLSHVPNLFSVTISMYHYLSKMFINFINL